MAFFIYLYIRLQCRLYNLHAISYIDIIFFEYNAHLLKTMQYVNIAYLSNALFGLKLFNVKCFAVVKLNEINI